MHTRFACMLLIGLVTIYMGRRALESGVDRLEVLARLLLQRPFGSPRLRRSQNIYHPRIIPRIARLNDVLFCSLLLAMKRP